MYPLYVDAKKYGWDAFDANVLSHARSLDEMKEMEKAAILLYRSLVPNGYNQIVEDRDRLKWFKPASGWNKGVRHTAKSRAKMSASHTGAANHRARAFEYDGIVYPCMQDCSRNTGLTRDQLYIRLKNGTAKWLAPPTPGKYGPPANYKHTAEARQRMSEYRKANPPKKRPILLDGVAYPSIVAAVGVSGYTRDQIKKKLKRGHATYLDVQ